ncbi:MAG: beta-propeller domain-containing protein, partial [Actinomycetota bacterium]
QSVVGAGEIVYSSTKNMYVTSYALDNVLAIQAGKKPKEPVTRIHKFDISDPKTTTYVGSGEVVGFLLNQFSISEHGGYLRVASTFGTQWFGAGASSSESAVTVLREKAGKLVRVGSIDGLGIGERIFSVRFMGTKAYVVTFRRIDPLYVIDLRSPSRPRVRGKLKVPGYSGYLHPLSDSLLLGVGRDADKRGVTKGIQFSLFDVSQPAKPRRLAAKVVGEFGESSVESDHHAFLYWAPERLLVVPAQIWDDSGHDFFQGALALTVSSKVGFGEPVRLTHVGREGAGQDSQIRRSLVIGKRLLTVSNGGVLVSDLDSLTDRAWIPL